jgi:hypothetical protein
MRRVCGMRVALQHEHKMVELTHDWTGRYLSASELADLVAPPAEWVAAVVDWLASHGVRSYELSRNRDYITAHVDVDQAEALLACSFGRFRHTCVSAQHTSHDARHNTHDTTRHARDARLNVTSVI